jgi:hypothetical protein
MDVFMRIYGLDPKLWDRDCRRMKEAADREEEEKRRPKPIQASETEPPSSQSFCTVG